MALLFRTVKNPRDGDTINNFRLHSIEIICHGNPGVTIIFTNKEERRIIEIETQQTLFVFTDPIDISDCKYYMGRIDTTIYLHGQSTM